MRKLKLSDSVWLVAFELYLSKADPPKDPGDEWKVLQALVYDAAAKSYLGKLQGFPVEASGWAGRGDFGRPATMDALVREGGKGGSVFFSVGYSENGSSRARYYRLKDRTVNALGEPLNVGERGGESGCGISVSQKLEAVSEETVNALEIITCDGSGACQGMPECGKKDPVRTPLKISAAPMEK